MNVSSEADNGPDSKPSPAGTKKQAAAGRTIHTSFAPDNPTDFRERGEWKSKYPDEAKREQRQEIRYLLLVFFISVLSTFLLFWLIDRGYWGHTQLLRPALMAFCGGLLGGVLFSMKWLYHSIAKLLWHLDRRYWRYLTPWISAVLGMAVVLIIAGDLFNVFDANAVRAPSTSFGIGFLVGYFSDAALAKLAEIALTLFGTTEKHSHRGIVRRRERKTRLLSQRR